MMCVCGKRLSVFGLVVFGVVVLGGGCAPACPEGTYGPYDNRDRTNWPTKDQDWVCVTVPDPIPPPQPPNLDGRRPTDDTQFRDHATTARAAIFLRSCDPGYFFKDFSVTDIIEATYGAVMTSVFEQALLDHSNCFREKRNGCSAVQECLGIAFTPTNSAFTPSCDGWVAMTRFESSPGQIYDVWSQCAINNQEEDEGVDLKCIADPDPYCTPRNINCTQEMLTPHCLSEPVNCKYSSLEDRFIFEHTYPCAEYGLVCAVTNDEAQCTGDGPACIEAIPKNDRYFADFRHGITCEDETTLRVCMNGHEALLDCANRGLNIKCIGGTRPHCGADFQCNYDGTNTPPTCEGSLIHVCNAGVPMTFDCTELGFETCDPERQACKPKTQETQP